VAVDIAELEQRARGLLTPEVYDYYAGGSGSEQTLRASVSAWQQHWLMPRVLRDVSAIDTSVRLPWPPNWAVPSRCSPTAGCAPARTCSRPLASEHGRCSLAARCRGR